MSLANYELGAVDFERISKLVYEHCGINLHDGKRELVKARLGKRLREGNFKSFAEYYRFVTSQEGTDELIEMIDSISTNLTYFFREEGHFETLRRILAGLQGRAAGRQASFKVWSAGCSTGEEPYSLAMTLKESWPGAFKVVATDISTRVLRVAREGIYPEEKITKIPLPLLRKYFQIGSGRWAGNYRVKKELREAVDFMRFNLMDKPPADFAFDAIFCRNVMIYFDKHTQAGLINRFHSCLNKGGYLFVGHSESLTGLDHAFKYVEPSVYRK